MRLNFSFQHSIAAMFAVFSLFSVFSITFPQVASATNAVSTNAGVGSNFSPSAAIVTTGSTTVFSVTLDNGYKMTVSGCGGTSVSHAAPGIHSYATGVISGACTVTASTTAISGSITSSPGCTIGAGSSTCSSTVSWTTTNVTSAALVGGGSPSLTTTSGVNIARTLTRGTNTYTLYDSTYVGTDGLVQLAQASSPAVCELGTYQSSTSSLCVPSPSANILVSTSSIGYGETVSVTWLSADATSCAVKNGEVLISTAMSNSLGSSQMLTSTSTLTIDCWNADDIHAIDSKIVGVSPAPTGGIMAAPSCIISVGSSTCTGVVAFKMINASSPQVYITPPSSSQVLLWNNIASSTNQTYEYNGAGSYLWTSNSNGVALTGASTVISCAGGSTWDGTFGKCVSLPQVSWTVGSSTWTYNSSGSNVANPGFGERVGLSYSSSNAAQCDYQNPVGTHQFYSNSNNWVNQAFIFSHNYRVICTNAAGSVSADLSVIPTTVDALPVALEIPQYVVPSTTFIATATMRNTGTKEWDISNPTPHKFCIAGASQPVWGIDCAPSFGTTSQNGIKTFNFMLTAPNTPGDYSLYFSMREDGLYNESGSSFSNGPGGYYFGTTPSPSGDPLAIDSTGAPDPVAPSYVRVRSPKLVAMPSTVTFPDTVVGDPASNALVTVYNIGGGTINDTVLKTLAGPFSCSGGGAICPFTLGPGTSTKVSISFLPATTTWHSQTIRASSTSVNSVSILNIMGQGVDLLKFTPELTLDFGDAQGISGAYKRVKVTNQSTVATATNISIDTSSTTLFTCVSNCPIGSLVPGESTWVRLKFQPPLLKQGDTATIYNGSITFNVMAPIKTFIGNITGRAVPVKIDFREQ
jgi:hypothetical protein